MAGCGDGTGAVLAGFLDDLASLQRTDAAAIGPEHATVAVFEDCYQGLLAATGPATPNSAPSAAAVPVRPLRATAVRRSRIAGGGESSDADRNRERSGHRSILGAVRDAAGEDNAGECIRPRLRRLLCPPWTGLDDPCLTPCPLHVLLIVCGYCGDACCGRRGI